MTLPQKDCSPGWMVVQTNFATGLRNNQTTLGGRTASIPSGRGMGTCGMTWTALPAISTLVRKVRNCFHDERITDNKSSIYWAT